MRDAAVLILAAGAGTRMKSDIPKVLHTLAGRSMLAHAVHSVAAVEPRHLVVVVGKDRERVTPAASELGQALGRDIEIAVQDQQRGTGHAVECGLAVLPGDFAGVVVVTAADVPLLDAHTLDGLIAAHTAQAAVVTVLTTTLADPTGYGRILRTSEAEGGEVMGIVEQADATPSQQAITEVNAGVYAFDVTALRSALGRLKADNAQGELYLTDVIGIVRSDGGAVRARHIDDTALVTGVNDRVQLAAVAAVLNRRIVERHQRAGVTIIDPASTWIDVDVTIGRDTVVRPGTQLLGSTVVGEHCEIGPDTTLTDVTVGDGAQVVRTHGSDSVIGADAVVGPFTYLRPGTELGAAGKLGAFVETKNATIGTGTKVPHLTYVGDADIGEHSNIGASSVFVNYDGESKSRTTIGSHVRTGSDTMFVAPVTVGDGAYTGAGTVVREDVPPGALAVSAGPQRNIEGWVARKRPGSKAATAAAAANQTEAAAAANQTEAAAAANRTTEEAGASGGGATRE
ncbi:bifunctional UDP-N-acetylglucosamine diphosphorylase/glucosamine-1-phosphate N-acetyltransferase GlmU [Mycobacterium sp. ZZG]